MIVLDTHAWVWLNDDPRRLSRKARAAVEAADGLLVSAISVWEVATLVRRGRLVLDRPAAQWVAQALARTAVAECPVTSAIALEAAALDGDAFPGDPADRLIFATALHHRAVLVTRDKALRAFDHDRAVW